MIGYRISRAELEAQIESAVPGWLSRARDRTREFKRLGAYEESSTIWSEVKHVYMKLQGQSKCAFCERKLESVDYGKGEQAVEHFRPKGNIKAWKPPAALGVKLTRVPATKGGYYLLPYDLFNYSAACNPCNSALKRDYFPIAGTYRRSGSTPEELLSEKPLLVYPIGDFDEDPADLIGFIGFLPAPRAIRGWQRDRAKTTIAFFQLASDKRKNLIRERAQVITGMCWPLCVIADASGAIADARETIEGYTAPDAPHSNCAVSYRRLFESNRDEAKAVFDLARMRMLSGS